MSRSKHGSRWTFFYNRPTKWSQVKFLQMCVGLLLVWVIVLTVFVSKNYQGRGCDESHIHYFHSNGAYPVWPASADKHC